MDLILVAPLSHCNQHAAPLVFRRSRRRRHPQIRTTKGTEARKRAPGHPSQSCRNPLGPASARANRCAPAPERAAPTPLPAYLQVAPSPLSLHCTPQSAAARESSSPRSVPAPHTRVGCVRWPLAAGPRPRLEPNMPGRRLIISALSALSPSIQQLLCAAAAPLEGTLLRVRQWHVKPCHLRIMAGCCSHLPAALPAASPGDTPRVLL